MFHDGTEIWYQPTINYSTYVHLKVLRIRVSKFFLTSEKITNSLKKADIDVGLLCLAKRPPRNGMCPNNLYTVENPEHYHAIFQYSKYCHLKKPKKA